MNCFLRNKSGERFNRIVLIEPIGRNPKDGGAIWKCKCDCGTIKNIKVASLNRGYTKSCGCLLKEHISALGKRTDRASLLKSIITHGKSKSAIYRTWTGMIQRCLNPNMPCFRNYGGRGIMVCQRWLDSFESFYKDMGDRPEGTSLDRIDSNGNYEPSNCKWSNRQEQTDNRRTSLKTYNLLMARISELESEIESLKSQLGSKN